MRELFHLSSQRWYGDSYDEKLKFPLFFHEMSFKHQFLACQNRNGSVIRYLLFKFWFEFRVRHTGVGKTFGLVLTIEMRDCLVQTMITWPAIIRSKSEAAKIKAASSPSHIGSVLCIEHKNQDFLGTGLFLTLQLNVKDLYRVYYRKYCRKWVKIQISTMACRLEMIYTSFRTAICTLVLQISILSTLDWHLWS